MIDTSHATSSLRLKATVAAPYPAHFICSQTMSPGAGQEYHAKVTLGRLEVRVGSMKFSCPANSGCLRWDYEHDMDHSLYCIPDAVKAFEAVQHFFPGSVMERIVGRGRLPREKRSEEATSPWRTALVGAGFA